jgi:hypothetical protein
VHKVHRDLDAVTARILLLLKLRCNKRSAYTERPTLPLVEEEASFINTYMTRREQKSCSWISRRLKPGMTVLARAGSNLTDRPKSESSWTDTARRQTLARDCGHEELV